MSRYIVAADLHLGNHRVFGGDTTASLNKRALLTLATFQEIVHLAKEQHANLIIAGDLFDTTRPSPQLLTEVLRILDEGHVQTHVLVGNHDLVSAEHGDHALGPLSVVSGVTVVDRPMSTGNLLMVPFRSGSAREWLPQAIEDLKPRENQLLVTHMGIIHKDTPPFLRDSRHAIPLGLLSRFVMRHKLLAAVSGDWHTPHDFVSECCYQIGSGCPTGFDDHNRAGRVLLVDTTAHKITSAVLRSSPVFVTTDKRGLHASVSKWEGHPIFVRVEADVEDVTAVKAALDKLEQDEVIHAGEVVFRAEQGTSASQAAAVSLRSGATLVESVAMYVDALETKVDKAEVTASVLRRLGVTR